MYLSQNITSQIVQEREIITFNLGDYFKGSLLNYNLCIANWTTPEDCLEGNPNLHELNFHIGQMVRKEEPFEVLNTTQLNDTSYLQGLPPFPRSTFLMEDEDGTQVIYLVDRNYMFMRYDLNNYTER